MAIPSSSGPASRAGTWLAWTPTRRSQEAASPGRSLGERLCPRPSASRAANASGSSCSVSRARPVALAISAALAWMQALCSLRVWRLMLARLITRLQGLDPCRHQSRRSGLRLDCSSHRPRAARGSRSPDTLIPSRWGGMGRVRRLSSVIRANEPQLPVSRRIRS